MATLDLQTISSGDSLDNEIINNNINALNAVPLTGTTLNGIPTFSPHAYISAESINNVFTKIKENWIDTSDGTAETGDILDGKIAYVDGKSVIGTIPTKTSDDLTLDLTTATLFTFTVPAGYYASDATKNMPTVNITNPTITVSSSGLITASVEQSQSGYVREGFTSKATQRLTTQAAKTITPSTSQQTAVAKGRYTTGTVTVAAIPSTYVKPTATKAAATYTPTTSNQTIAAGTYCSGAQTIKGDSNLVAGNIKSGVSIFGVNGTYSPVIDVPATQWSSKYLKTLYPTLSNTTAAITVKAMTYYDGYWYGIGNDSAGDAWKLYGTTTGNMTAYKCGSSRNYPITGIVCDGTNVWLALSSGGYSNRVLLYQSIANFRSNSTALYTMTSTTNSYSGAFQFDNSYSLAYGVNTSTGNATFALISSSDTKVSQSTGYSSVPEALVSGCAYKNTAVAVTSGGYIMQSNSVADSSYYTAQLSVLNGAQKCCVMGDYLCVACVRDGATYLCFTSDDNVRSGTWNCFKVTDSALTVVGMAYANGLYTLVTKDSVDGTTTTVWQTTDIKDHGLYGQEMSLGSEYTVRAMASGGNYICLLADNGSTVQKALVTVNNKDTKVYRVIDINDDNITVTEGEYHTEITIPNSANLSSITALEFGGGLTSSSDLFYFARRRSVNTTSNSISYSCPYICMCDGYDYLVHEECGATTIKYTIIDDGDVWTYLNNNDLLKPTDWSYITGKIVGL